MTARPGTIERTALPLDAGRLAEYLRGRLDGCDAPVQVRQFPGGQSNPTYHLTCGDRAWVLRKKPPGALLPTAHAVDREYRVLTALTGTDVPVPRPLLYCDDSAVIGTEFFVMEFLPSRIFWDPTLPELAPSTRATVYAEMGRVLAALHSVDYVARALGGYGKPGNYFARQIGRWTKQYLAVKTDPVPAMDRLIEWLPAHVPDDDTTSLVHGDFRLDNLMFHPSEPRVLGVIDWELSTLGHPLADLAYNCMPYHLPPREGAALAVVAGGASGIPTEPDYVAAYCSRTGRDAIPAWGFYLAFSIFRYASIVQGVYHRGLQGNASAAGEALGMRERAVVAAETGWAIVARG